MFGESRFSRCGSFWQRGCGNFFAWFAGRTAPQCTPCDHSCWNATNQKCNKPCGCRTNRTCDRTLIETCLGVNWAYYQENSESEYKVMGKVEYSFNALQPAQLDRVWLWWLCFDSAVSLTRMPTAYCKCECGVDMRFALTKVAIGVFQVVILADQSINQSIFPVCRVRNSFGTQCISTTFLHIVIDIRFHSTVYSWILILNIKFCYCILLQHRVHTEGGHKWMHTMLLVWTHNRNIIIMLCMALYLKKWMYICRYEAINYFLKSC